MAALAVALGNGLDLETAMGIANVAAGVAVGHPGTWAVNREELLEAGFRFGRGQLARAEAEAARTC